MDRRKRRLRCFRKLLWKMALRNMNPAPKGLQRPNCARPAGLGPVPLFLGDDGYPERLRGISDAPPLIWLAGRRKVLDQPTVAIVGARNASALGTRMARRLALGLGQAGYTVVSGLARGIDAAAHHASLATGTIAVQAGGLDVMYPAENTELAKDILQTGLRISEQPFGLTPQARHFPRRNRLISGLADAVIVVEAAAKSGTLITARQALDQGREVLAVPGHPIDARAEGCNMLIRDGAVLVRSVNDVLEALTHTLPFWKPLKDPTHNVIGLAERGQPSLRPKANVSDLHRQILDRLGPAPTSEDQLSRDINCRPADMGQTLVELEMNGKIQRHPGGLVSKL